MTPTIEIGDLEVRYGRETALRDVTLTLPGDRIYGLLGRNGAGKTTLLSVIAGFRRPSTGTMRLGGEDSFEPLRLGWPA